MGKRGRPKGKPRKVDPVQLQEAAHQQHEENQAVGRQEANEFTDQVFAGIKHSGDPQDKELLGAMYDDRYARHAWDATNPVEVPPDIIQANPNARFKWRAKDEKAGTLRKGNHYDGWQRYESKGYPEGLTYGGDLILCFMPQEMADARNRHYQEESSRQVRDMQELQLEAIDRAATDLRAQGVEFETLEPGSQFQSETGRGAPKYPTGIKVGPSVLTDRKTGRKIEQYRGYHPDQVTEMAARRQEDRSRNKRYSIPGVKPGG